MIRALGILAAVGAVAVSAVPTSANGDWRKAPTTEDTVPGIVTNNKDPDTMGR